MTEEKEKRPEETRALNALIPEELMKRLNMEAYEKKTSMTAIVIEMLKARYKI